MPNYELLLNVASMLISSPVSDVNSLKFNLAPDEISILKAN